MQTVTFRCISPAPQIAPARIASVVIFTFMFKVASRRSLLRREREGNLERDFNLFWWGIIPGESRSMADAQVSETTQLLRAWANGDPAALEHLTPRVYQELRRIAGHFMQNERPGRTLQTTALVHEASFG
jgi:ECF sigma factor